MDLKILGILGFAFVLALALAIFNSQFHLSGPTDLPKNSNGAIIPFSVDFSEPSGEIRMSYGVNEDDNWMAFADDRRIQGLHEGIKSSYIRVWVSSQSYRKSTIPLLEDGSYDFTSLDAFINAVLQSNAIPFVVFAHAPGTFGEGHGNLPPASDADFAAYVATIVDRYDLLCRQNLLAKDCNVNQWYFEIWNEPYLDEWWQGTPVRYSTLFNEAYIRIKQIAPQAKVGGLSGVFGFTQRDSDRLKKFLEDSKPDFITIHHYGNLLHSSEKQKMEDIRRLFFDSILKLRVFLNEQGHGSIEIIQGEYNSDLRHTYMRHLDEQMTAAWYASALIWQIKSQQVGMELFYSGTSHKTDQGFGMWSYNKDSSLRLWPTYSMKSLFANFNTKGSALFEVKSDPSLELLAIQNDAGRFITIVDTQRKVFARKIQVSGAFFDKLVDVRTKEEYFAKEGIVSVPLGPYEMRILRLE